MYNNITLQDSHLYNFTIHVTELKFDAFWKYKFREILILINK